MTFKKFTQQLNGRQILIHFIAFWFFGFAFQTLAYLFDIPASKVLMEANGGEAMMMLVKEGIPLSRVDALLKFVSIVQLIGLLTAFVLSLLLSVKQNWFWGNAVIVLIIAIALSMLRLLGWQYLKYIFLTPGELISNNAVFYFLINGLVLLSLGILTFFLTKFIRFINKGNLVTVNESGKRNGKKI